MIEDTRLRLDPPTISKMFWRIRLSKLLLVTFPLVIRWYWRNHFSIFGDLKPYFENHPLCHKTNILNSLCSTFCGWRISTSSFNLTLTELGRTCPLLKRSFWTLALTDRVCHLLQDSKSSRTNQFTKDPKILTFETSSTLFSSCFRQEPSTVHY